MSEPLKGCPFCGANPVLTEATFDHPFFSLICDNEACVGIAGTQYCDTQEEAEQSWNHRYSEPEE